MDEQKNPGIQHLSVELYECKIGDLDVNAKCQFHLGLTALNRHYDDHRKIMAFFASFDLMSGVENPPFQMTFTLGSIYTRPPDANMEWDELTDAIVLAHLIPFVREFVASMSIRLPTPELMIPPINTYVMLNAYEESVKARDQVSGKPA